MKFFFFDHLGSHCILVARLQVYFPIARCVMVKHATLVSRTRTLRDTLVWKDTICPAHAQLISMCKTLILFSVVCTTPA